MKSGLASLASSPLHQSAIEVSLDERTDEKFQSQLDARAAEQATRRQELTLWRRPLATLWLFVLSLRQLIHTSLLYISRHLALLATFIALLLLGELLYVTPGAHQPFFQAAETKLLLGLWWMGLGVLSSVGLGTGLHTFLLYLGPHIAKVTLTATECGSTAFETYGANAFICASGSAAAGSLSFWDILFKVQFEAFLWGFGTALGELPPYFVARAARAANKRADELAELDAEPDSLMVRAKRWVTGIVQRVGFFGILVFASIPNPLFDLAGLTCGHIGVPFWTFFTATAIGKAVVKVHGQAAFVITIFNVHYLESLLGLLASFLPEETHAKLRANFETQRTTFHRPPGEAVATDAPAARNLFATLWDVFLFLMIAYFVVSIVNSLAQSHQETLDELELLELEKLQGNSSSSSSSGSLTTKPKSRRPKSE